MSELITTLKNLTSRQYTETMYLDADKAINAVGSAELIDSFNEFKRTAVELIKQVNKYALRIQKPLSGYDEYYLHSAFEVLRNELGTNGEKAAFERARTGKEGGIYAVMKIIAYGYMESMIQNETNARIGVLWEKMSNQDRFAVMDEYVSEFGHLWPDEVLEGSAVRLKVNFPKTLQLHIENIRKQIKKSHVF